MSASSPSAAIVLALATLLACRGAEAQSFRTLYSFNGPNDGVYPVGGLLYKDGALYGTTSEGGAYGAGTFFGINATTGAETSLIVFDGKTGQFPAGSLSFHAGSLYGTTVSGGAGNGNVFRVDLKTQVGSQAYQFGYTDGAGPRSNLTYVGNAFYGTTADGGAYGAGTVFRLAPKSGKEKVLYSFTGQPADGGYPIAGLLYQNGLLYGMTSGNNIQSGNGNVFQIDPLSGKLTVLFSFTGLMDGSAPLGNLIAVGQFLYGTTEQSGAYGGGTIFKVDTHSGKETTVYSFGSGLDGSASQAGLFQYHGKLYGTTSSGGAYRCGTVFVYDPKTGAETVLYSFTGGADSGQPESPLIGHGGNLYGTAYSANHEGAGTVFELTP